uniref:Protein tiptop-like n=2 Tax=Hirondellea gigas TaxID=1518452 RepID=A0A6A7FUS4_9CRUS
MPRRKQDCPKRMKWEEEARLAGQLRNGDEMDSPGSSPRHRRSSGSGASRDGMSPRASPRESLTPSPGGRYQRNSPNLALGSDSDADMNDFNFRRSPATMTHEDLLALTGKLSCRMSPNTGFKLGESPLDLSVPRKRAADALLEAAQAQGKMAMDMSRFGAWGIPLPPHLASAMALRPDLAAHGFNPDFNLWNGKSKPDSPKLSPFPMGIPAPSPSEASKALERMSELSRRGAEGALSTAASADFFRAGMGGLNAMGAMGSGGGSSGARANAWQSHWLSKGQDATRDVLKCVWCKASFTTLADLTTHMKEAKHCGVALPPPSSNMPPSMPPGRMGPGKPPNSSPGAGGSSSNDLVSNMKETMPLPRKLVRGQDVWLGKGAEQTKQILKCMWCGQSFKSLADMTRHMQQTQHYTNIISQEQIISWKSPEDKSSNQSHVSAVLTCKVCDQAFSSLKELSSHMVKLSHYKEHIMRSITESGSRRRQTREKRKKSLPVRKLLELERAQQDLKMAEGSQRSKESPGRISCEKCGDKIDTTLFVDHIRNCLGTSIRDDTVKSSMLSPDSDFGSRLDMSRDSDNEDKKTPDKSSSDSPKEAEADKERKENAKEPSVLSALEKLIEKSFDTRKSKPGSSSPLGSSILRRLGIDESTDYSKPLMEPHLMYNTFSRLHGGPPIPGSSSYNLPPSFGPDRDYMRGPEPIISPRIDSDMRDTFPRSPLRPGSRSGSRPTSAGSVTRDGSDRSLDMLRQDRASSILERTMTTENGTDHSDMERDSPASREEYASRDDIRARLGIHLNSNFRNLENSLLHKDAFSTNSQIRSPNTIDFNEKSDIKQEMPMTNGEESELDKRKDEIRVRNDIQIKDNLNIKKENADGEFPVKEEIRIKEELRVRDEFRERSVERDDPMMRNSPMGRITGTSPAASSRSGTPHSEAGSGRGQSAGGLGALAGLLGSTGGGGGGVTAHPLAALQKLCDKTETSPRSQQSSNSQQTSKPGSIIAFTWACNDAVTAENSMKCAFCDVPFVSKGAYRHHLSKMHFVKDGIISDNPNIKQNNMTLGGLHNNANNPSNIPLHNPHGNNNNNNNNMNGGERKLGQTNSPTPPQDDSPHSKFLKYTELAKQLSSK